MATARTGSRRSPRSSPGGIGTTYSTVFLDGSQSPITLLELGLHARSGKLLVVCTPGFYRYDNVRITCARYGVPVYGSIDEAIEALP